LARRATSARGASGSSRSFSSSSSDDDDDEDDDDADDDGRDADDGDLIAGDEEVEAEQADASAAAAAAAAAALPPPPPLLPPDASRYERGQGAARRSRDRARAVRLPGPDDDDDAGRAAAAAVGGGGGSASVVTAAAAAAAASGAGARKRKAGGAAGSAVSGAAGSSKVARGSSAGGAAAADAASAVHDDPLQDELPGVKQVDARAASQPSRFYHVLASASASSAAAAASSSSQRCVLQFSTMPSEEEWYCDLCDSEGGPGHVGARYSCRCADPIDLCSACAKWRREIGEYRVDLTAAEAKQFATDPQGRPTLPASEHAKYVSTARRATMCKDSWDCEVLVIARFLVVVSAHTPAFHCLSLFLLLPSGPRALLWRAGGVWPLRHWCPASPSWLGGIL